jgi:hypothetical protein
MAHFGAPCVFLTISPLETRSLFCWKLCNADFNLQHYPNLGEAKLVMPNDFETIKLVRANPVAQAIFFGIILKLFRTIACGFSSFNLFSQDVDANGKPMGFFRTFGFCSMKGKGIRSYGTTCTWTIFFKIFQTLQYCRIDGKRF